MRILRVELEKRKDLAILKLPKDASALSTAVDGGLVKTKYVVFKKVDKNFSEDLDKFIDNVIKELGLPKDRSIVFLTAADIEKSLAFFNSDDVLIASTISHNPLACIGGASRKIGKDSSTINIFVMVKQKLSERALVELLSLVSEVKALVLSDLCLSCEPRLRAFQSAVDSIAVATLGVEPEEKFVGPVTRVGSEVSRRLYEILTTSLLKRLDLDSKFETLTGISLRKIVELALEVYHKAPVPHVSQDEVGTLVKNILMNELKDPNVWALISSYKCPEILSSLGWFPNLSKEEYDSDSTKIVSDEVLGIGLSLYVNGIRGLLSYYWVDRNKPKIDGLADLPPFLDDIISALIGSVLSKVYDKLLRGDEVEHIDNGRR